MAVLPPEGSIRAVSCAVLGMGRVAKRNTNISVAKEILMERWHDGHNGGIN